MTKAINKGSPSMATQQKKVQGIQQDAIDRIMNPAQAAEKLKQSQAKQTILGGSTSNGLG